MEKQRPMKHECHGYNNVILKKQLPFVVRICNFAKGGTVVKYVVCYDIPEGKVRYRMTKCLQEVAYRVQYSVFTGDDTVSEIRRLQRRLERIASKSEKARVLVLLLTEESVKQSWSYGVALEEKQDYVLA